MDPAKKLCSITSKDTSIPGACKALPKYILDVNVKVEAGIDDAGIILNSKNTVTSLDQIVFLSITTSIKPYTDKIEKQNFTIVGISIPPSQIVIRRYAYNCGFCFKQPQRNSHYSSVYITMAQRYLMKLRLEYFSHSSRQALVSFENMEVPA